MTTFNFRGLPDCFVRMIRFFVVNIIIVHFMEMPFFQDLLISRALECFCGVGCLVFATHFFCAPTRLPASVEREKRTKRGIKSHLRRERGQCQRLFLFSQHPIFQFSITKIVKKNIVSLWWMVFVCVVGLSVRTCNLIEKLGSIFGNRSRTWIHLYVMHGSKVIYDNFFWKVELKYRWSFVWTSLIEI